MALRVLLVLLLLMGLVWIGQGADLIRGSFMTGDPKWAVIGAILSAVAALLLWNTTRPRTGERRPRREARGPRER